MQDKTTITVERDTKMRLAGELQRYAKTYDEMINQLLDECEKLRKENEILADENRRLKEENGGV